MFLGSGAVIHALAGEQDIRKMGGLKKELPITYWTFLIGAIAIAGLPPLAGFFSKDEILFETWMAGHWILWIIGALTALLTATYMAPTWRNAARPLSNRVRAMAIAVSPASQTVVAATGCEGATQRCIAS